MIRVCVVGCGKMADQHAAQILRVSDATLVGVCDSEPLMARQMAERFRVPAFFSDVGAMLTAVRPDVVHVTTPPQTHHGIGCTCLESGACVYIEKPFTLNTAEAEELVDLANRKGLHLTAGHNGQFSHAMEDARRLVRDGFLGDRIVHMESLYGYSLGDPAYAKAFLGDREHWVRRLPGSLLQNIISHGVSRIAEFISGDRPSVSAHGFPSAFVRGIGQDDIIDELRLTIRDEASTTAYFTFSSQIGPVQHQFRLYGSRRSLLVDDDHQVVVRLEDHDYKSFVRLFRPPVSFARQYVVGVSRNVWKFARSDFHMPNDRGLLTLTKLFYRSIVEGTAPPIPYREILVTSRIMDDTFRQLAS